VTGVGRTKLDSTIGLTATEELELPVKLIGIGEGLEDLRTFDPDSCSRALLDVGG
jgi:fused signal recognition particle receptor